MQMRYHQGYGHGLKPGTTSDLNCMHCTREDQAKHRERCMNEPAYITTWDQVEPGQWVLVPFVAGAELAKVTQVRVFRTTGERTVFFSNGTGKAVRSDGRVAVLADGVVPEGELWR